METTLRLAKHKARHSCKMSLVQQRAELPITKAGVGIVVRTVVTGGASVVDPTCDVTAAITGSVEFTSVGAGVVVDAVVGTGVAGVTAGVGAACVAARV